MPFDPVAFTLQTLAAQFGQWLSLGIQATLAFLSVYLLVLAIASRKTLPQLRPQRDALPRWAVLVPAHDEAQTIARLLESLADLDYPAGAWQLFVIADNCTDATASVARQAGRRLGLPLTVLERDDAIARGKGHALAWALNRLCDEQPEAFDAWAVFDADTVVDRGCLMAFAGSLQAGHQAIQGRYGILEAETTPRRQMAYISAGLYQQARAHGREVLKLSAGLFGNGMAYDWAIAQSLGWLAFSVVEDIEYQSILALHGIRVHYQPEAMIWAEAPTTLKASSTQRQRWERGRYALIRYYVGRLLATAIKTPSAVPFWMAIDLAMPSYTLLWAVVLASGLLCLTPFGSLALWLTSVTGLAGYLAIAWGGHVKGPRWVTKTLVWAPVFAVWALAVNLKPRAPKAWVRTPRE